MYASKFECLLTILMNEGKCMRQKEAKPDVIFKELRAE